MRIKLAIIGPQEISCVCSPWMQRRNTPCLPFLPAQWEYRFRGGKQSFGMGCLYPSKSSWRRHNDTQPTTWPHLPVFCPPSGQKCKQGGDRAAGRLWSHIRDLSPGHEASPCTLPLPTFLMVPMPSSGLPAWTRVLIPDTTRYPGQGQMCELSPSCLVILLPKGMRASGTHWSKDPRGLGVPDAPFPRLHPRTTPSSGKGHPPNQAPDTGWQGHSWSHSAHVTVYLSSL